MIIGVPSGLPTYWAVAQGAIAPDTYSDYLVGPYANLTGASLYFANLTHVDLYGANLTDVGLGYATLEYTILEYANLTGADLIGTDLTGAFLNDANLTDAILTGATMSGVVGATTATWSSTTCPDGTNSDNDGDTCVNNGA